MMARKTGPRRLANKPRPKIPHRVWAISWGYRDNDPRVTWILSLDQYKTKGEALARIDKIYGQWLYEEAEYTEVDVNKVDSDVAVYGPFLESYIRMAP
jgi:hypothetical protein